MVIGVHQILEGKGRGGMKMEQVFLHEQTEALPSHNFPRGVFLQE